MMATAKTASPARSDQLPLRLNERPLSGSSTCGLNDCNEGAFPTGRFLQAAVQRFMGRELPVSFKGVQGAKADADSRG